MSKTKIAVVTGANKGLGFAVVKALCKEYDGKVYLTSRDEKRGIKACEELQELGLYPAYHQLDVTDKESVDNFLKHFSEQNEDVEILVNNAAIMYLKDTTEPKLYRAVETLDINYFSLVRLTEAILPLMNAGARIVNITSSSGHLARIPSESLRKKFQEFLSVGELNDLMNSYVEDVKSDQDISNGWGESEYVVSKVGVNAYTFMLHQSLSPRGKVETNLS